MGPPGPGLPPPGFIPRAPPGSHRQRVLAVVVTAIVLLSLAGGVFAYVFLYGATSAHVNRVVLNSPDNACDLGAVPITYTTGFTVPSASQIALQLEVPNYNVSSCTIRAVGVNVSGWSIVQAGVPLAIPGLGRATLNLTIQVPAAAYSGTLWLMAY